MPSNKKIMEELGDIKDYLIDNKLQNVNFDTLDLTEIIEEPDSKLMKNEEKKLTISDMLNKDADIENLVIKLLEPKLKKWLNTNLPSIVKQVVDKEIKKIIPKNE